MTLQVPDLNGVTHHVSYPSTVGYIYLCSCMYVCIVAQGLDINLPIKRCAVLVYAKQGD